MVRTAHRQLLKENVAQRGVEVLSRVDKNVAVGEIIELFDDAAEANYFRPRAKNGHYPHASMSSS